MKSAISADVDVVVCDFITQGHVITAQVKLGYVDLGGVLARRDFLGGHGVGFLNSLPAPHADSAKDVHDADFWWVQYTHEEGWGSSRWSGYE